MKHREQCLHLFDDQFLLLPSCIRQLPEAGHNKTLEDVPLYCSSLASLS